MATKRGAAKVRPEEQSPLPEGVQLVRTLKRHTDIVTSIAFDPVGRTLVSGSEDDTIKISDVDTGDLLQTWKAGFQAASISFHPDGRTLATGSVEGGVRLWNVADGSASDLGRHKSLVMALAFSSMGELASGSDDGTINVWGADGSLLWSRPKQGPLIGMAFHPNGRTLATAGEETGIRLWNVAKGGLRDTLEGHRDEVRSLAFDPEGRVLASGSWDMTIKIWDPVTGKLLRTLEGHTDHVQGVTFVANGKLLASKGQDDTVRLWRCDTWEPVAVLNEPIKCHLWFPGLSAHPTLPMFATIGSAPGTAHGKGSRLIHLWELDLGVLLGQTSTAVHHLTAKIVVVGDSGVGKTGLGWRLAHGEFKEHPSTHGQQFWVLDSLSARRGDGAECEAVLWDLAGQPDYRLIHALFLDDADLALLLFDPTDSRDPLHGVEFWLKQLAGHANSERGCPTVLVGARVDRGTSTLTDEELQAFCRSRGLVDYLSTSAKSELGVPELIARMKKLIPWEDKSATVTTVTFKRIKDYVLKLKESGERRKVIVSPADLRKRLEKTDRKWSFSDTELSTAVGHLENYGYVKRLRTSRGEEHVLLVPELLNNLAASYVLEARRNAKGLGSLDEKQLLSDKYRFDEIRGLTPAERTTLLDSAALLFLNHNICFRETDPLGDQTYLVFPELINLKKPMVEDEQATEDDVAYTVSGPVENVYSSLVVLLGYTQQFTRTNQWHNHARYEIGNKLVCGFRLETERDGELEFVLYFGTNVGRPVRTLFQGLFESFLARRNVNVLRYERVQCPKCHAPLDRSVVRTRIREGKAVMFCADCGEKIALPKAAEPIQLTQNEQSKVDEQHWFASQRSRFEQAIFQVDSYVETRDLPRPKCFISYAWGQTEEEKRHDVWVERSLATDLQKAGIDVILDRWENARIGANISRFVERITKSDRIVVVGTPLYARKYANEDSGAGYVVAAEGDLITKRMRGTEAQKETVAPVLLAGSEDSAFPPLLQGRVFADFRDERAYFVTAFDLILSLYGIAPSDRAVADLREPLQVELEKSRMAR